MQDKQTHSDFYLPSVRKTDGEDNNGHWLTVSEVAERFQVSRNTVGRWVRAGLLSAIDVSPNSKVGAHRPSWRIRSDNLENFVESRVSAPRPPPKATPRRKASDVIEFIK